MSPRRRPQGNRGARGRGARGRGRGGQAARGGHSGFIQASDLPANYQGGQPSQQAQHPQIEPQEARLRIAFWPWDIDYPFDYDFNMDDALMEVRGLPSGHLFNDFELEEYITERLADYEYARAEMPANSWQRLLKREISYIKMMNVLCLSQQCSNYSVTSKTHFGEARKSPLSMISVIGKKCSPSLKHFAQDVWYQV
jgi:hypothetical protein